QGDPPEGPRAVRGQGLPDDPEEEHGLLQADEGDRRGHHPVRGDARGEAPDVIRPAGAALVALLAASRAVGAGDTLDSRPRRVTVFPAGALVERTGSIQLGSGHHLVLIPDLPASADESSLRLSAVGPAGTKLYGVQVKSTYSPEEANVKRRELEGRIRALADKLEDLTD